VDRGRPRPRVGNFGRKRGFYRAAGRESERWLSGRWGSPMRE
jgi:hypothetical protein